MARQRHRQESNSDDQQPFLTPRRKFVAVVAVCIAAVAIGFRFLPGGSEPKPPPAPPPTDSTPAPEKEAAPSEPSTATQPTASTTPDMQKLVGNWLRYDGGKRIEIRHVDERGQMDAAYFNPAPIKVSKAEATQKDGRLLVFVELRDTNYPGCTYRLVYLPDRDQLVGIYFQAAIQEQYEVYFERQPR